MSLVISDDTLRDAGISETELREEIAVLLFEQERLTLGQASRLARTSQAEFLRVLGRRQIPVHYGVTEFQEDLKTLQG